MWWATWWAWWIAAAVLAIAETLLPAYVFLGFALGAFFTGGILLVGGPLAAWIAVDAAGLLLCFALLSLAAWYLLRRLLGVRAGQVKLFDRDINEE